MSEVSGSCIAFEGTRRIAAGALIDVALEAKAVLDRGTREPVLIFDDETSRPVEVDFRGAPEDVRRKLEVTASSSPAAEPEATAGPRGRGRPRLGVVAREVTLLPRHWEWLATQPGGASVTLRKLVEEARRAGADRDRVRQARESAYRFMNAMAGDQRGFEEAIRALFAGDAARFEARVADWPVDVRDHALMLARRSFG